MLLVGMIRVCRLFLVLRRRGYTAAAIRDFCERIGVAKANSLVDVAMLEHCVREDLNAHANRIMAVLDPIKVVITNYPEDKQKCLLVKTHQIQMRNIICHLAVKFILNVKTSWKKQQRNSSA